MGRIINSLRDIDERRYRERVPSDVQDFIQSHGLPLPDTYIEASARPPYLPPSARALLFGEQLPPEEAQRLGVPVDIGKTLLDQVNTPEQ